MAQYQGHHIPLTGTGAKEHDGNKDHLHILGHQMIVDKREEQMTRGRANNNLADVHCSRPMSRTVFCQDHARRARAQNDVQ